MQNRFQSLSENFVASLKQVLGRPERNVSLHEPEFRGREWDYVKECLDTGWVSSVGKFVDRIEAELATITGAKHAVAVVNGTAALQVAMMVAGVRREDEVIIPALSFVATANAVAHCGAIPHFVDSEHATLGMDPDALAAHLDRVGQRTADGLVNKTTGRHIAAIVPMHTFGHAVRLERLVEVADQFGLPIVEDAAESLGTIYRGKHTGTWGKVGVLSFNGNKIVTTGGGGAILTDDPEIAKRAKHLTTTGKRPHRWEFFHDTVAFNFRMPNINAALGCAQLERLPDFVARKVSLAARYREVFEGFDGLSFVPAPAGSQSNFWLNAVRLTTPDLAARDALLGAANEAGYQCRPIWNLLSSLPMYQGTPRAELPVAQNLEATLINLPSSPCLVEAVT